MMILFVLSKDLCVFATLFARRSVQEVFGAFTFAAVYTGNRRLPVPESERFFDKLWLFIDV